MNMQKYLRYNDNMVRDYILDACAVREWGGGPSELLYLHNKVAKIMIPQGG